MTEPSEAPEWTLSDAWILAAVSPTRPEGTLTNLIGIADGIRHAIPTRDELASGIGALRAAGLVACEDERIFLTREGKRIREYWTGGLFEWDAALLPALGAVPRPGELFAVADAEVDAAYQEYIQRL